MATERGRHLLILQPVKDWPEAPKPEVTKTAKTKGAASAIPAAGVKP
jgi:hypothetical protein